jgi:hypothetical protein
MFGKFRELSILWSFEVRGGCGEGKLQALLGDCLEFEIEKGSLLQFCAVNCELIEYDKGLREKNRHLDRRTNIQTDKIDIKTLPTSLEGFKLCLTIESILRIRLRVENMERSVKKNCKRRTDIWSVETDKKTVSSP